MPVSAPTTALAAHRRPRSADAHDDGALAHRVLAGEPGAFEVLMRRNNQRLFRVARGVLDDDDDAADAVQQTYLRAFTHMHRYSPGGSLPAWLAKICLNEALMQRRQRWRQRPLARDDEVVSPSFEEPDAELVRARARAAIERAIARLPHRFRVVFLLRAVEQQSTAETARCLGIAVATVKTRLHRARQLLRADLPELADARLAEAFRFDGARCDRLVRMVLARLHAMRRVSPSRWSP